MGFRTEKQVIQRLRWRLALDLFRIHLSNGTAKTVPRLTGRPNGGPHLCVRKSRSVRATSTTKMPPRGEQIW